MAMVSRKAIQGVDLNLFFSKANEAARKHQWVDVLYFIVGVFACCGVVYCARKPTTMILLYIYHQKIVSSRRKSLGCNARVDHDGKHETFCKTFKHGHLKN